jgi:hypothetical protein
MFSNLTLKLRIAEARDNPLQFQARSFIPEEEASTGSPPKYPYLT